MTLGLFRGSISRKAEEAFAVERERMLDEKYAAERDWLAGVSDAVVAARFDAVWAAFHEVKSFAHRGVDVRVEQRAHNFRLEPVFQDLQTEWLKIDRSNLGLADAHTLFVTLNDFLPHVAGLYKEYAAKYTIHTALYGYAGEGSSRMISDKATIISQLSNRTVKLSWISHSQWAEGYAASLPKASLCVPQLASRDRELVAAVEGLHGLWVKADACSLAEADRFFVDEVAARYFPDAWRLFQSFVGGDDGLLVEARAGFLEQVGLMGRRLAKLCEVSQSHALGQVEAHSAFLREVTSGSVAVSS